MSQALWIGKEVSIIQGDIIDERPIDIVRRIMDQRRECRYAIHNPRDIIDKEPIHNIPKIMDWSRGSIMT